MKHGFGLATVWLGVGEVLKPYGKANAEGWTYDGEILKACGGPGAPGAAGKRSPSLA